VDLDSTGSASPARWASTTVRQMSDPSPNLPLTQPLPAPGGDTAPSPLTLLLLDQRARWQQGVPVPIEAYLQRRPELGADASVQLLLIHHELELRDEHGQAPRLEEYLKRFPQLGEQLRCLFEVFVATRPAAPSPLPAVPGYTVVEEVGKGGMGVVYRAWQGPPLERFVALKMIRADLFTTEAALARFRTEVGAIARMQHPNVVQIYGFGEYQGQPYCVLEWVGGGSLAQRLAGQPVEPAAAAALMAPLAEAMHHVHERGVVHRDLKPGNVLLSFSGADAPPLSERPLNEVLPKVADFGLARRLDGADGQTETGDILGTPPYMAPEQAEGRLEDVGPPTDVYALGAILYELLTGRPPFQGTSKLDTLEQVRLREPVPPRLLQPRTPRDLETICLACLRKDVSTRYGSALALAEDLRRFLAGEPIRMRQTPLWERALKWARRHPARALLGGTGVLAVGAVVLGLLLVDSRQRVRQGALRAQVDRVIDQGQLALIRGEWTEAQRNYDRALATIENEPGLADLAWNYAMRGWAEAELLQDAAAEADFRRAEQALQRVPAANAEWALLTVRGKLHQRQKKLDAARQEFRRATELRPEDWLGFVYLAQVCRDQRRLEEALQALSQARALQVPPALRARLVIEEGNVLYDAHRYEEAVERCAAVEADLPSYAEAYRLHGRALAEMADYPRAACAFDAYFRNGGQGDPDLFRACGFTHLRLADYATALADYTRAYHLLPPDAPADAWADLRRSRGWAYVFAEAWPLAVADFDAALALRANDGDAHSGRGYALVKLEDYQRGVADAEEALRLGSATPEVLRLMAACVFAQAAGKAPEALAAVYRRRAVDNLLAALPSRATAEERWVRWRDEILLDKGLDPIRESNEVQALHGSLRKAAGGR
jgi:serine/threonine protein kinase/Flp pilus assembly protein TadD